MEKCSLILGGLARALHLRCEHFLRCFGRSFVHPLPEVHERVDSLFSATLARHRQPVSGELVPRPNFTLCKSKSTACRLSSQWPRTDQTRRSHQFMNSISDRSLIGHIVRFTPTTKSSDKSRSNRRLVQASTVRLPSIGRQIRDRS